MTDRCTGITSKGIACRAFRMKDSKFCQAHDPAIAAERAAWRRSGGLARAIPEGDPIELMNVEDVRKGLAAVIGSTWKLQNTAERSRALCQLYMAALKTFELGDLTFRVEALENRPKEDNRWD